MIKLALVIALTIIVSDAHAASGRGGGGGSSSAPQGQGRGRGGSSPTRSVDLRGEPVRSGQGRASSSPPKPATKQAGTGLTAEIRAQLATDIRAGGQKTLSGLKYMASARSDLERSTASQIIRLSEQSPEVTKKISASLSTARARIKSAQKTAPPSETQSLMVLEGNAAKVEAMVSAIMTNKIHDSDWPAQTARLLAEIGL